MSQKTPIVYSPVTGTLASRKDLTAAGYRDMVRGAVWKYNPWTGAVRMSHDVKADPEGLGIVPPGEDIVPARRQVLPTDAQERKAIPIYSGFVKYFPRGIVAVAELSLKGSDQHHPGQPVHWDRGKSSDELDALMRHMIDDVTGVPVDTDEVLHATKLAWRAMANLEKILEKS